MTGAPHDTSQNNEKGRPGFGAQIMVTLAIVLATGAVFGGIWLLDAVTH